MSNKRTKRQAHHLALIVSRLYNLCDWALLGLIQEQRLEHVVVEGWMVQAGSSAVRAEIHLQDLGLHDPLTCPRNTQLEKNN